MPSILLIILKPTTKMQMQSPTAPNQNSTAKILLKIFIINIFCLLTNLECAVNIKRKCEVDFRLSKWRLWNDLTATNDTMPHTCNMQYIGIESFQASHTQE